MRADCVSRDLVAERAEPCRPAICCDYVAGHGVRREERLEGERGRLRDVRERPCCEHTGFNNFRVIVRKRQSPLR